MPQIVISEKNRIIEGMRYTGDLSARLLHPDGMPYHTFRSYSVLVDGENLLFRRCRIEGGVDFIFGGAEAYFDDCELRSVEPGFVFAPSTPEGQKTGFVARNCRFTCTEAVPSGSCYIGRPWRDHARLRLEHCELGRHIHPRGFDDWGRPECRKTVRFEEIGSYGVGAENADRPEYILRAESCVPAISPAVGTAAGSSQ